MASPVAPTASSVPFTGGDSPSPLGDKSPLLFTWPFSCRAQTAMRTGTLPPLLQPDLTPPRQRGPDSFDCDPGGRFWPRPTPVGPSNISLLPLTGAQRPRPAGGAGVPHPSPGARSLVRAEPLAAADPRRAGELCQPVLGGKPPRGAVSRTWTACFPSLLLCVNGPPPTSGCLPSFTPPLTKAVGHRGQACGRSTLPSGHPPCGPWAPPWRGPAAPLFPARHSGRPGGSAGGRGREQRRRRGPAGAPSPPLPLLRPRGLRRREQRDRAGEGAPRVPGRTKRAAQTRGPRRGEVAREGARSGRAERTHLSVGLSGGSACCLLGGHVAPGSLGALAAHDGGLLGAPGAAPGSRRRG